MIRSAELVSCFLPLALLALACGPTAEKSSAPQPTTPAAVELGADPHSYARPEEVEVKHLKLDLTVDFEARRLKGRASLTLAQHQPVGRVVLDIADLDVSGVTLDSGAPAQWSVSPPKEFVGSALVVELAPTTREIHIDYVTRPEAGALQWLSPAQTAGGKHPFLFTQSQAILARTWIPLQDTPTVRFTYEATVHVPAELLAVMSAENPQQTAVGGVYHFQMPQVVPSYLMSLAVGHLSFAATGPRTGVYAEPERLEKAAWEFAETEDMIVAAEKLYGPYAWGRYDLLVLPPSFPFGGMENPRLTFATPTVIAGDRSLVSLVAHELAHSWSGNLVTNADWNDFWINEGFTVYLEKRIMEVVYGQPYTEMLWVLDGQELAGEIASLGAASRDTHLHLDLAGRNPDDGMNAIAYQKGAFFLRTLEAAVGRESWDRFFRGYFEAHAWKPMTSKLFLTYLKEHLPEAATKVDLDAWVYGPGLPPGAAAPKSVAFEMVEKELLRWRSGTPAVQLRTENWSTHERMHFLRALLEIPLSAASLADLDAAWGLTASGNADLQEAWFEVAIANNYQPAYGALEKFLLEVGRRKYLRPLYTALAKTPEGKAWALGVYSRARPGYHLVSVNTVDPILGFAAPAATGP